MKIVDERKYERDGFIINRGIQIYPFINEDASDYALATSAHLTIIDEDFDDRTGRPVKLDTPKVSFNMQLRELSLAGVAQLQMALAKATEISLEIMAENQAQITPSE
jgi:hypothetical protein